MRNIILAIVLAILGTSLVFSQDGISSSQVGYFKADTIHRRTNVVKGFIDATNVLRADRTLEYVDIIPYDYIRVYANDIFKTNSYVKDSTYRVKLISHVGVNRAVILFENDDSFTVENGTRAPLDVWLDLRLKLYVDEINGKHYIIKIEVQ